MQKRLVHTSVMYRSDATIIIILHAESCYEEINNCNECEYVNGEPVCIFCEDGFDLESAECNRKLIG